MIAILTETRPKARRDSTCTLCLLTIPAGETYRYYTCAGDGTVWTNKEHEACANLVWGEWGLAGDDFVDASEVQAALPGDPS